MDKKTLELDTASLSGIANQKKRNLIKKTYDTIRTFLPADPSSPWPKELRKKEKPGYAAVMLAAFDKTIGASCQFGYTVAPVLKHFTKWQAGMSGFQKKVFDAIDNGDWLFSQISFPVNDLRKHAMHNGYKPKTVITVIIEEKDRTFEMATDDILRLLYVAKEYRKKEVRLIQATEIGDVHWYGECFGILLTFEAAPWLYVHILSKEKEE